MDTLRYDYKPKAYVMALSGLLFAGFGVLLGKEASENDAGLLIDGIIRLDVGEATGFYWILAGLCVLFVAAALFGLVRAFGAPHQVVLDRSGITAPKGAFGRTVVNVRYDQISDLQVTEIRSQRLLTIHHTDGKLVVSRSMLPSRADFDEIFAALDTRCRAARGR